MPCECLAIIESKSKVRYSGNKPVVAKVSMNTSTSGISPDVVELKDMVKALLLDKKSQNQAPATMKAVEESCVTCGAAHSYRIVQPPMATFIDTIFKNSFLKPLQLTTTKEYQLSSSDDGNNFNHGSVYQPLVFQPPAYQAPVYKASDPQTQGVSKEDFSAYVKANDAVMRNIASTSSLVTLPSNTIANPRSDLKAITTQSGRGVVIGISRPLSRVVKGATVIITTVMDQTGMVVVTTTAAATTTTTTTLAVTTG
nr:hypothetical protein [Tanacetum cinerariifolium]